MTSTAEQQTQPDQKVCGGTCKETLPLSDFPVNRAQVDGRNLYCKACTLDKVHAHRDRLKAYKAAKAKRELANAPKPTPKPKPRRKKRISDAREVLQAIKKGNRTFSEIRRHTKRTPDRIADAIAILLLNAKCIRMEKTSNGRLYLPASSPARKPERGEVSA